MQRFVAKNPKIQRFHSNHFAKKLVELEQIKENQLVEITVKKLPKEWIWSAKRHENFYCR